MIAWLIEARIVLNRWVPIAVAGVENQKLLSVDLIEKIREKHPVLVEYPIRIRRFARLPGVHTEDDLQTQIIVIE